MIGQPTGAVCDEWFVVLLFLFFTLVDACSDAEFANKLDTLQEKKKHGITLSKLNKYTYFAKPETVEPKLYGRP